MIDDVITHARHGANRTEARRLRAAILAHLKRYKRKCSSAQRLTVSREREHVRGLDDNEIVAYVRHRGPLIGFVVEVQS